MSDGKKAPAEVDLQAKFKEEAKDPAMIAYLKSLGPPSHAPFPP